MDIEHIAALKEAAGMPLVLHGGSGIRKESILAGVKNGIAKINVGTEVRQTYEQAYRSANDTEAAREAVYRRTVELIAQFFEIANNRDLLYG